MRTGRWDRPRYRSLFYGLHNVKARLKGQQEGPGHLESSWRNLPKRRMRMVWDMSSLSLSPSCLGWRMLFPTEINTIALSWGTPSKLLSYACSVVSRNGPLSWGPRIVLRDDYDTEALQLLPSSPSDILIIRSCLCWWIFRTRLRGGQKHKAWVGS